MKTDRNIYTIGLATLTVLLAVSLMVGCKDQENIAIADNSSRGLAATSVAISVVTPVSIRDVVFLPGETEAYDGVFRKGRYCRIAHHNHRCD